MPSSLQYPWVDPDGARPARPVEHRIYVMLGDDRCLYGVSYLSSQAAFSEHLDTFWSVVQSVRPVESRQATAATTLPYPLPID